MLVAVIGCGGGGSRPGASEEPADAAPPDPITVVEVAVAGPGSVAEVLVASAVVESEASAMLVPEATGVVREIRKDEGDVVRRGDVLAVLDNVTLGTGAARASAEVTRLQQQLDEARELANRGAVSAREVEDLEYQLRSAQLSSTEARRSFGSTRITAPFAGVVAMRDVRVGELATSAQAAFQVVDPARLRVVASIPERDLGRVSLEQPVRLVSAYDSSVWASGRVQRLSPVVDANTGTFRATVGVDEPARLRPGQFVSVQIEVDRHDDVLVVPKPAVVYEDGVPVVYAVIDAPDEPEEDAEEDETPSSRRWWPFGGGAADEATDEEAPDEEEGPRLVAERRLVNVLLADEEWAEVERGVQVGDRVVVVGQSHLRDGGRVRVAEPEPEG